MAIGGGGTFSGEAGNGSIGGFGNGTAGGPPLSQQDPLVASVWQVQAKLSGTAQCLNLCGSPTFTLALTQPSGNLQGIWGKDGQVGTAPLTVMPNDTASATATTVFPGCPGMTLSMLHLWRSGAQLFGTGTASSSFGNDGAPQGIQVCPFDVTLTGTAETAAPQIIVGAAPLNPIDSVKIAVSEPLASGSLNLAGSPQLSLNAAAPDAGLIAFTSNTVLPFSTSWQLAGAGADFAGHALTVGQTLTTLDPGVFAQDGFEGSLNAILTEKAAVFDDSGNIKPPTGHRALLIPRSSTATLHLQRTTGQTLKFNVTELFPFYNGGASGPSGAVLATVGGTQRKAITWVTSTHTTAVTDPKFKYAADTVAVETPIPEAGSDVAVQFAPTFLPPGPSGIDPSSSLLIDDLRIE